MRNFSRIISVVFHPIFMTSWGATLLLFLIPQYELFSLNLKLFVLGIIFIFTTLIPILLIPIFKKLGLISEIEINNHKQRVLPMFITGFFYLLCFFICRWFHVPFLVNVFILSTALIILIISIITYFYKISIHSTAIAGLVAVSFSIYNHSPNPSIFLPLSFILLAGMVGSTRLYLNAHQPSQIYWGYLLGFVLTFSVLI